ncbi:MAG: hypothetical protein ACUVT5_00690 [Candidatus Bathyarchaeales archaeon]
MKPKFIQCDFCKSNIELDKCEFAAYRTAIDGKEYVFCCAHCAKQYKEQRKKKTKK